MRVDSCEGSSEKLVHRRHGLPAALCVDASGTPTVRYQTSSEAAVGPRLAGRWCSRDVILEAIRRTPDRGAGVDASPPKAGLGAPVSRVGEDCEDKNRIKFLDGLDDCL